MEWTDDQGYQWVPILRNFAKSYLWGGRMIKNTNEYLVLKILLILLARWTGDQGCRRVSGPKITLSPTYGIDR